MVNKMISAEHSARYVRETNARMALCQTQDRMCAPWMHLSDSTRLDSALVIDEVSFCSASLLGQFEHRTREEAAAYYQIKYTSKNDMPVEASKDSH